MNIFKTLLIAPLACLIAMPVAAHHYDGDRNPRYEKRIDHQKSRIREGIKSGDLTRKEASKLRKQQKQIASLARKYESDGHLSRHERKKLEKKQDKASKKIYRLKHNDQLKTHRGKHKHHHHGYHDGHRHGWNKKPYKVYRRHGHSHDHGYVKYGGRYFDDDGWSLVLRLSDDF